MEENKNEVQAVKVEETNENQNTTPSTADDEKNKTALIGFILLCIGATVCGVWIIGSIAGLVLAIIARKKANEAGEVTKNPYRVFQRITQIASIVLLILSIVLIIFWAIWTVAVVILGATAAVLA